MLLRPNILSFSQAKNRCELPVEVSPLASANLVIDCAMKNLGEDQYRLSAARGWLDLGDCDSALAELDEMSPRNQDSPEAMTLRCEILMKTGRWELALILADNLRRSVEQDPFGWYATALALHNVGHTREGYALIGKFPGSVVSAELAYTSARLACSLGLIPQAALGLKLALTISSDPTALERRAADEPDLQPLWLEQRVAS